jgi:hypothetical protein
MYGTEFAKRIMQEMAIEFKKQYPYIERPYSEIRKSIRLSTISTYLIVLRRLSEVIKEQPEMAIAENLDRIIKQVKEFFGYIPNTTMGKMFRESMYFRVASGCTLEDMKQYEEEEYGEKV